MTTHASTAGERQVFEAWRKRTTKMRPDDSVALDGFGDDAPYVNSYTQIAWRAWQARAALSARSPVQEEETHPPYCSGGCCNPEDAAQGKDRPVRVSASEYEAAERATLAKLDMLDVFELASAYTTLLKKADERGSAEHAPTQSEVDAAHEQIAAVFAEDERGSAEPTDDQILDLAEKHLTPGFGDVLVFARAVLSTAPARDGSEPGLAVARKALREIEGNAGCDGSEHRWTALQALAELERLDATPEQRAEPQGLTDAEIDAWASEEQFILFAGPEDVRDIVRSALQKFAARASAGKAA